VLLELAEVLDCPGCRSGTGLVTLVHRAVDGRVSEGQLGCPLCEAEFRVTEGVMQFAVPSDTQGPTSTSPIGRSGGEYPPPEAVRVAAFLGLQEVRGGVVLLGPGLAPVAGELVALAPGAEFIVWADQDLAGPAGVNPLRGAQPGCWPLRSGRLAAAALLGPAEQFLEEAVRCLAFGARIAVLEPGREDLARLAGPGFQQVAADQTAWVGNTAVV